MPRVVPLNRTLEKNAIWDRHREPCGFKFYGTFRKSKLSQPEHFEFSVIESRRKNPRAMGFFVRHTIGRMIYDNELPPQIDYKCYDGFVRLHGEDWQPIDRVLFYDFNHTRT